LCQLGNIPDTCPIWNSLEDVAPAEKEMTCDGCLFKNKVVEEQKEQLLKKASE